jgi:hypothetical protein
MARGELLKKLFATCNRSDEFRTVAMQIINEEENKEKPRACQLSPKDAGGGEQAPERRLAIRQWRGHQRPITSSAPARAGQARGARRIEHPDPPAVRYCAQPRERALARRRG